MNKGNFPGILNPTLSFTRNRIQARVCSIHHFKT